jgi:hypothetical protein
MADKHPGDLARNDYGCAHNILFAPEKGRRCQGTIIAHWRLREEEKSGLAHASGGTLFVTRLFPKQAEERLD